MASAFSFISGVSLACVIAVFAICYFPSLFVLYFFVYQEGIHWQSIRQDTFFQLYELMGDVDAERVQLRFHSETFAKRPFLPNFCVSLKL
jgi:hypothetical protein